MERLNYETRENLIKEAKKYNFDELELFQAELGWQDWMNDFTDAAEGEEITETESNLIDDITRQAFLFAHKEEEVVAKTKRYKDFDKVFIGASDIASLIIAGCRENEGLVTEVLDFGEDGRYTAYIIERTSSEEVSIGSHYTKVLSFNHWIRIYDDDELTFRTSSDTDTINIYRAGDFGCIIELIRR